MAIDFGALNKQPKTEAELVHPMEEEMPVAVQKADPFDIEPVKKRFSQYKIIVDDMVKQANEHKIIDQMSREKAISMMGQARTLSKKFAKSKEDITAEHRKFTGAVNKLVKFFADPLESIVSNLKAKDGEYAYHLLIKEREEKRKEEERKAALQKKLDAEAKKANVEAVVLPDVPVDTTSKRITRTESGSSLSSKLVWKGIIVNPDLVDRAFCSPDQKKIDEAVAGGLRESPGLDIKEVAQSRLRA